MKTNEVVLESIKLRPSNETNPLEAMEEYGKKVKEQTGYTGLLEGVYQASGHNIMARTLGELGLRVYPEEQVRAYQAQKLEELLRTWKEHTKARLWEKIKALTMFLGLESLAVLCGYGISITPANLEPVVGFFLALLSVVFILGGLAVAISMIAAPDYTWARLAVNSGDLARIPLFAIDIMMRVKTAIPSTDFYVEELRDKATLDPFLIAELGGQSYYLAVWNEPGFQVK